MQEVVWSDPRVLRSVVVSEVVILVVVIVIVIVAKLRVAGCCTAPTVSVLHGIAATVALGTPRTSSTASVCSFVPYFSSFSSSSSSSSTAPTGVDKNLALWIEHALDWPSKSWRR